MKTSQGWALLIVLVLEKGHVFFVLHKLGSSGWCPVSGEFCCRPPKTVGAYKPCQPEWADVNSGLGVSILLVARAAFSHALRAVLRVCPGISQMPAGLSPESWSPSRSLSLCLKSPPQFSEAIVAPGSTPLFLRPEN